MKRRMISVISILSIFVFGLLSCDLTSSNDKNTNSTTSESTSNLGTNEINKYSYYNDKDYKVVVDELNEKGFTNVTIIRSGNLKTGWLSKENTIKEMTVVVTSIRDV